jgi:hypothetical protein
VTSSSATRRGWHRGRHRIAFSAPLAHITYATMRVCAQPRGSG